MPDKIIGVHQFSDGTLRNVHEDMKAQFVLDDHGRKIRGTWISREEDWHSQASSSVSPTKPKQIGICLFTDGMHRIVYRDDQSEFVFDDYGNKVRGNWITSEDQLFEDDEADTPFIARAENEKS
jgi:hypothetical protein